MLARKLHYTKLALDDMIRTTQRASDSSAMALTACVSLR